MKHVNVTEAHQLQSEGATYVDVRSTREFDTGHPAGAVNVPLLEPDEQRGARREGRLHDAEEVGILRHLTALVGCQAGMRSLKASQMLETFGFTDVTNVRGGFGGARDQSGALVEPGWITSDLPVETDTPAERTYDALLDKADKA
jgi:rhodanese-related sulfurtransferase